MTKFYIHLSWLLILGFVSVQNLVNWFPFKAKANASMTLIDTKQDTLSWEKAGKTNAVNSHMKNMLRDLSDSRSAGVMKNADNSFYEGIITFNSYTGSLVFFRATPRLSYIFKHKRHNNGTSTVWVGTTTDSINKGQYLDGVGLDYASYMTPVERVLPDRFTIVVAGFDIKIAAGADTILRIKDFKHPVRGKVLSRGAENVSWKETTPKTLYSKPQKKILDIRDFNIKSGFTAGTIKEGKKLLMVANSSAYKVGDKILIETGGEDIFYGRRRYFLWKKRWKQRYTRCWSVKLARERL
jgi:hypothetical protein